MEGLRGGVWTFLLAVLAVVLVQSAHSADATTATRTRISVWPVTESVYGDFRRIEVTARAASGAVLVLEESTDLKVWTQRGPREGVLVGANGRAFWGLIEPASQAQKFFRVRAK